MSWPYILEDLQRNAPAEVRDMPMYLESVIWILVILPRSSSHRYRRCSPTVFQGEEEGHLEKRIKSPRYSIIILWLGVCTGTGQEEGWECSVVCRLLGIEYGHCQGHVPVATYRALMDTCSNRCLSKQDANAAYWLIKIHLYDQKKTAFITKRGLLKEFTKIGFGLCNSLQ